MGRVICAFDQFQYFPAVVKATITDKMQYEVKWEDGTKDNLIHRYDELALNMPPNATLVGKGTTVLFPQGTYKIDGSNKNGSRWHKGIITDVYEFETEEGEVETRYAGRHVKRENEIRYPYRGYRQHFHDINIKDIRLPPNPMDALLAFNK